MNQECARLPSTLCVYSQIEADQQKFFTFDPIKGNGTELLAARMKKEDGDYDWGLSPDGKYLVTHLFYGPQKMNGLRILPLAGGPARFVPISGWIPSFGLDWAADSKSIWVSRDAYSTFSRREKFRILNVDINGKARMMLELNDEGIGVGPGIPSPDGRYLALCGVTYNSNVWLLDNF